MKTLITAILILAICTLNLNVSAQDKPTKDDKAVVSAPVVLGMLVLTVAAAAAYVVVKVYSTNENDNGPVTLVLQESCDNVNWSNVATNTVILAGRSPVEAFSEEQRSGAKLYRAKRL